MAGEGRGMPAGHPGREGTKSIYTEYGSGNLEDTADLVRSRKGGTSSRGGGKSYRREAYRIFSFPDS